MGFLKQTFYFCHGLWIAFNDLPWHLNTPHFRSKLINSQDHAAMCAQLICAQNRTETSSMRQDLPAIIIGAVIGTVWLTFTGGLSLLAGASILTVISALTYASQSQYYRVNLNPTLSNDIIEKVKESCQKIASLRLKKERIDIDNGFLHCLSVPTKDVPERLENYCMTLNLLVENPCLFPHANQNWLNSQHCHTIAQSLVDLNRDLPTDFEHAYALSQLVIDSEEHAQRLSQILLKMSQTFTADILKENGQALIELTKQHRFSDEYLQAWAKNLQRIVLYCKSSPTLDWNEEKQRRLLDRLIEDPNFLDVYFETKKQTQIYPESYDNDWFDSLVSPQTPIIGAETKQNSVILSQGSSDQEQQMPTSNPARKMSLSSSDSDTD